MPRLYECGCLFIQLDLLLVISLSALWGWFAITVHIFQIKKNSHLHKQIHWSRHAVEANWFQSKLLKIPVWFNLYKTIFPYIFSARLGPHYSTFKVVTTVLYTQHNFLPWSPAVVFFSLHDWSATGGHILQDHTFSTWHRSDAVFKLFVRWYAVKEQEE